MARECININSVVVASSSSSSFNAYLIAQTFHSPVPGISSILRCIVKKESFRPKNSSYPVEQSRVPAIRIDIGARALP